VQEAALFFVTVKTVHLLVRSFCKIMFKSKSRAAIILVLCNITIAALFIFYLQGNIITTPVLNINEKAGQAEKFVSLPINQKILFIMLVIVLLALYFLRSKENMQKSVIKPAVLGQTQNSGFVAQKISITFDDIAGNEEAKRDMREIVDFLKTPEKFRSYGITVPRGIILYGPPGTGKTLLAKALAGTANVNFIATSGSDFMEKYVGVGASRVRDLFKKARENAPAIIFIDEIDAIAKARGLNTHDERDQTLNQILAEMDGFKTNENVIVIAATNRIEVLDKAILRAGRFDRHIYIPLPDIKTRYEILKIHARNKPLAPNIDLMQIARTCLYMSGADLANLLNEAGIYAVRNNHPYITQDDINKAMNKVIIGEEKRQEKVNPNDRNTIAYHEAGHALIAKLVGQSVPRVSIIPTTKGAEGYALIASEEKNYQTKKELLDAIAIGLAGRAAEELVFGENNVTNGAGQDLKNTTRIAMQMVKQYGMSSRVGLISLDELVDFQNPDFVITEVQNIIKEVYDKTVNMLKANKQALDEIAGLLIKKETIGEKEINKILAKNKIQTTIYQPETENEDIASTFL